MWILISGTAHRGQVPSPGPNRFTTSTPDGRRSLRSCQTKILIFNGNGAFHNGEVQGRTGPLNRALYADPTVKPREGVNVHDTLSGDVERDLGSISRSSPQDTTSAGPKVRRKPTSHLP